MSVEELLEYLRSHWQQIRKDLLDGTYKPSPVKRHELPKPGGAQGFSEESSNPSATS